jgi:phospholipid/cholesterol/gamma-HCH transport system substrate-binding protein
VLVNGFQIGRVSKMQLGTDGQTTVEFKIDPQYNIPDNTLAKLQSTDLLGSKAIVFELGNSTVYAEDKDTLRADIQGSLAESLQPIQKKAEVLISKVDSAMGAINNLNSASNNLNNLFIDIKAHPSRYVHFSVFGKKD